MRTLLLTLLLLLALATRAASADVGVVATVTQASPCLGTVRLYWDANTETNLGGYVLHWGLSSRVYTSTKADIGKDATTVELTGVACGRYYFALRAFDTAKAMSGYSNEVEVALVNAVIEPTRVPNPPLNTTGRPTPP